MEQILKFKCPKCGTGQYETGEIFASGSMLAKTFGLQNRRFTFVSCDMCHFTEFYRVPKKRIGEVMNFTAR